ncbi:Cytochrome p450 [Aspergillus nanangensis]|uniref:Cytochrome p450 n=1 Tax=Aspergillus nanangensis TaxID=2582783 RepID=A0AAD4GQ97_ASPNN|nr:Cytochrome p450 [Aspergillus nanangensis]
MFGQLLYSHKLECVERGDDLLVAESKDGPGPESVLWGNPGRVLLDDERLNRNHHCCYHQHPLLTLQQPPRAALPPGTKSQPTTWYIRCHTFGPVSREPLRVRPASSFGLPRIVPKGGREIAGKFIPEDVIVSVPTYSLLRQKDIFGTPSKYIPDRWLTEGPNFQQTVVIATVVEFFDRELAAGFQLETQERFNSNAGDLPVKMTRVVV